jgi:membrane-associated protease RseP (regulator of RpoE activity)
MPVTILMCADPLSPRRVDEHFTREADAVHALGGSIALIDHDALQRGDADGAVRGVPRDLGIAWYRGWMATAAQYTALAAALAAKKVALAVPPDGYQKAHELPGWYDTFAGVTPASVWLPHPEQLGPLSGTAGVIDGGPAEKAGIKTGDDISQLNLKQLAEVVERTTVFTRVDPEQKLKIIQALQKKLDALQSQMVEVQGEIQRLSGSSGTPAHTEQADIDAQIQAEQKGVVLQVETELTPKTIELGKATVTYTIPSPAVAPNSISLSRSNPSESSAPDTTCNLSKVVSLVELKW